jgi:HK97 family phage major capsid protein
MAIDLRHRLKELGEQRNKLIKLARGILETAEAEKRSLTAEERKNWDAAQTDIAENGEMRAMLKQQYDEEVAVELDLAAEERAVNTGGGRPKPEETASELSFECRGHKIILGDDDPRRPLATTEYRKAFWKWAETGSHREMRNLQMDSDTAGGYLIPPAFVGSLIEAVDDLTFIRGMSDVYLVPNADSVGRPTRTADIADDTWTTELSIGSEDTALAFGKREMTPHPLAKSIRVSRKLIRAVAMGIENYVRTRMAYKIAVTQEKAFLTGSGAGQPLGIFTESSDGISTTQDYSNDNTATAMTADGLKGAFYTLKQPHRMNSEWIFHRDGVAQIMKLKDGNGNYLLMPSNNQAGVDMLFGRPIHESEFAPNTFTTGLYVGILGNFSHYMIVDALSMEMQRLDELYAGSAEVGFINRSETDGAPVLEEAFVRVKLG